MIYFYYFRNLEQLNQFGNISARAKSLYEWWISITAFDQLKNKPLIFGDKKLPVILQYSRMQNKKK